MSESKDPKEPEKVTNNDLRNSQNAGGVVNADTVNAQRIGGDIWNIKKFIFNFIFGQQLAPVGNPARPKNQRQLLAQVSNEVESRISHSLHNRIYIIQDTNQNPSQIELPWASEIKVGSKPKVHLTNTEITAVYDQPDIAGRLLILGEPGVGKTTILLKLAEELVNRAKSDSTHPIPMLFSLSSWKNDSQSIKDWLVEQLKDKYGVRKDIGKQLVDNQEIIPLLDGLDEVAAERQEKCAIKINEFLHPSNWTNPTIVCSRIEEYQRYQTLLQLNNSLELCPFKPQQVYLYLHNTGNTKLWDSLNKDANFSQLAKIPFLLNIIVLSAQEISIQTWQQFQSSEEQLKYLFEVYIEMMLEHLYKNEKNNKKKQLKYKNTKYWLGWLAQRLKEENTTDFLIEKIQPSWLQTNIQEVIYNFIIWGVIGTLIYGLIYGLFFGETDGLIYGLFFGVIYGLIGGFIINEIEVKKRKLEMIIFLQSGEFTTNSQIKYIIFLLAGLPIRLIIGIFIMIIEEIKQNKIRKTNLINFIKSVREKTVKVLFGGFIGGFIGGLTLALRDGLISTSDGQLNLRHGLLGIITGIVIGSPIGLLIGEDIQPVESKNFSRKKFLNGLNKGLFPALIGGVIVGLIGGLIYRLFPGNLDRRGEQVLVIFIGIICGLIGGIICGLIGGIICGFEDLEINKKMIPNQGIYRTVTNTIIIIIVITVLTYFIKNLLLIFLKIQLTSVNLVFGLFLGLLVAIPSTGTPAIKHFLLRLILSFNGYIPWNYAKFLNNCTNGLFLQRVGGSYRFMHDLLREHFAKYYSPTKN